MGLGEDFLACIAAAFDSITSAPAGYALVDRECRRALVRRFPYAIFFEGDQRIVTIYAILHASRDPEKWRSRLPQRNCVETAHGLNSPIAAPTPLSRLEVRDIHGAGSLQRVDHLGQLLQVGRVH